MIIETARREELDLKLYDSNQLALSITEYLKSIQIYGLALPRLAELINSPVLSTTAK